MKKRLSVRECAEKADKAKMKKKVMLVFGTRPEAIKMCPLVMEFRKYPEDFETVVCVTGQHREMLDQVLKIFEVKPDFDLNIMKQGQDLTDVTCRVLTGLRDVFKECRPDVVLVHEAKVNNAPSVELWGTGSPLREFLYVVSMQLHRYLMAQKHLILQATSQLKS